MSGARRYGSLLVARRSAVEVRREALVQLRGVIVTAPDRLREPLRGLPTGKLLTRCTLPQNRARTFMTCPAHCIRDDVGRGAGQRPLDLSPYGRVKTYRSEPYLIFAPPKPCAMLLPPA